MSEIEISNPDSQVSLSSYVCTVDTFDSGAFTVKMHPRDADVFIGYSTTPGQISPISMSNGTLFFSTLAQCLRDHYKSIPLEQIYTLVTDIVASREQLVHDRPFMHVPQKISTLRMPVFFTVQPDIAIPVCRNN